ncbi:hypothetical protein ACFL3V_07210 [Nanoarchaeota archaeon]
MIQKLELIKVPSNSCDIFLYQPNTIAADIGVLVNDLGTHNIPPNMRIRALTDPRDTDPINRDPDIYNKPRITDLKATPPEGTVGYEIEIWEDARPRTIIIALEDRLQPYPTQQQVPTYLFNRPEPTLRPRAT